MSTSAILFFSRFKCEDCSFRTMSKRDLGRHLLKHKKPGETPMYHCEICAFRTKHQRYLKSHTERLHLGKENTSNEIFYCAHCSYSTNQKKSLKSHMILHG